MDMSKASDTELITIIKHDKFASALDVASAAEEWERRHSGKSVYSIVQYKIKEAHAK